MPHRVYEVVGGHYEYNTSLLLTTSKTRAEAFRDAYVDAAEQERKIYDEILRKRRSIQDPLQNQIDLIPFEDAAAYMKIWDRIEEILLTQLSEAERAVYDGRKYTDFLSVDVIEREVVE